MIRIDMVGADEGHQSDVRAVLRALRTARDEYELTQAIAAFAQADSAFAAQLARALIACMPDPAEELLAATPPEVSCTPERRLFSEGEDKGPVDMLLEGDDWALLVEHKIYSPYDPTQLHRYMEGGAALGVPHWGLIAVTRGEPYHSLEPVRGTPHWLGSVRWASLVEFLRQIAPEGAQLETLWQAFLDVEIDNGDFGVINLDPEVVRGWAAWKKGRSQLAALLQDLIDPTLECLTEQLPTERSAEQWRHTRSEGLWLLENSIHARFRVPADGQERLRVQFLSAGDELYFTVEARHENVNGMATEDRDAYRERARGLGSPFQVEHRNYAYVTHVHDSSLWLRSDGQESASILRGLIKQDVEKLAGAGLLDQRFDLPVR